MPLVAVQSFTTTPWREGVPSMLSQDYNSDSGESSEGRKKRALQEAGLRGGDQDASIQSNDPYAQLQAPPKARRIDSGNREHAFAEPGPHVRSLLLNRATRGAEEGRILRYPIGASLNGIDPSSFQAVAQIERRNQLLSGLAAAERASLGPFLTSAAGPPAASALHFGSSLPLSAVDQALLGRSRNEHQGLAERLRLRSLDSLMRGVQGTASLPLGYGDYQPPLNPYESRMQPSLAHSALGNAPGLLSTGASNPNSGASVSEAALAAARLQGFQLGSQLGSQIHSQSFVAGLTNSLLRNQNVASQLGQAQASPARLSPAPIGRSQLPRVLARPEDKHKLSSHQVLLRNQIEAFAATEDDISTHTRGRNKPIQLGQIGIRCRHCAHLPVAQRLKGSTYFPASTMGLYQAAQNMSTTHMQCGLCPEMPESIKQDFARLLATKSVSSGAGRPYWAESAKKLGLMDTEENGIRYVGH